MCIVLYNLLCIIVHSAYVHGSCHAGTHKQADYGPGEPGLLCKTCIAMGEMSAGILP